MGSTTGYDVLPMDDDDASGNPEKVPTADELRELTGYDAPAGSNSELVKRHFDEAQYRAAEVISAMATGMLDRDMTRLKAAIYIIEFIHGPVSKGEGKQDPWSEALRALAGGKTDGDTDGEDR